MTSPRDLRFPDYVSCLTPLEWRLLTRFGDTVPRRPAPPRPVAFGKRNLIRFQFGGLGRIRVIACMQASERQQRSSEQNEAAFKHRRDPEWRVTLSGRHDCNRRKGQWHRATKGQSDRWPSFLDLARDCRLDCSTSLADSDLLLNRRAY